MRIGQRLAVIACALLAVAGRAVADRPDAADVGRYDRVAAVLGAVEPEEQA